MAYGNTLLINVYMDMTVKPLKLFLWQNLVLILKKPPRQTCQSIGLIQVLNIFIQI